MNKVAIMADSIASIPQEIAKEYGIKVIPFHTIIDGKDYLDPQVDMKQLYIRLKEKENLPTTSAFSIGECLQAYQELSQETEAIICISLTSAFTMGYKAAIQAREIAQEKLPKTTIEVIDSRTTSGGEQLIILEAAKAAAQGKNLREVIEVIDNLIPRLNLLSTRDTLFYLDKGGLIFEARTWAEAESASSFRTIVEIDASSGGVTKPLARAKTKAQIMEKIIEITKERAGGKRLHAAIVHTNVLDQAEQLKEKVLSQFHCDEFYISEGSGATAVKNGQGLIDFGFYGD